MMKNYGMIGMRALLLLLLLCSTGLNCFAHETETIVEIRDNSYQPSSITIPAGTTVTWINKDSVEHTVTATDVSFDSGNIARDGRFNLTFSRPGKYQYQCLIHASMVGEVIVVSNSTAH